MAITNPTPQPKEVVILQREDGNAYYEEVHISGSNKIIYIDASGYLNADDSASFYTVFPPAGGTGGGGTTLYTGSTYQITASWASQSLAAISASWAPTPISVSYAKSSSWANTSSWAINAINGGTQLITASTYPITASWAENASNADTASYAFTSSYELGYEISTSYASHSFEAESASWASSSISASWAPNQGATTLVTASTYEITSSWANNVTSASWASRSFSATTASWSSASFAATSASYASTSFSSTTASWSSASFAAVSASWASASFSATTSSWSSASLVSVSASYASASTSASYAKSASWADNAASASYAPASATASYVGTVGSASWASQSLSASWHPDTSLYASSSLEADIALLSWYAITASYAVSSSAGGSGGNLSVSGSKDNYFPFWSSSVIGVTVSSTLTTSSLLLQTGSQIVVGTFNSSDAANFLVSGSSGSSYIAAFYGNTNAFSQIKSENSFSGSAASVDFVSETNIGNDTSGYLDLGINNTGYTQSAFNNQGALDGYLYVVGSGNIGGNLLIGTLSPTRSIIFHTSGSQTQNERLKITDTSITASVPMSGSWLGMAASSSFPWSASLTDIAYVGGNVKIGNISVPVAKLEVAGNIRISSSVGSSATPDYIWLGHTYSNGTTRDKCKIFLYNAGTEQYGFSVGASSDVQYHSNLTHAFYIANVNQLTLTTAGMTVIPNIIGTLVGTSSWALNAISTLTAVNALTAYSCSIALASVTASFANSASWASSSISSSFASRAISASWAKNSDTSSTTITSIFAQTADYSLNSGYSVTASYALNAQTASFNIINYVTQSILSSSWSDFASSSISSSYTALGRSIVLCSAYTPYIPGVDPAEITVPYSVLDGSSTTYWNVKRLSIRAQISESVGTTINIEKSTGNGIFSPTTLGTITLSPSMYEGFTTGSLGTVSSGDKIRFNVTSLGTAQNWTIITEISNV